MKRITILCLSLALCVAAGLAEVSGTSARGEPSARSFWQRFKAAVIKGDKETVASLSQYPIGMSYGIASVKNRAQFLRRYREVFNTQTDAARCFTKASLAPDPENPKRFTVACPDAAGNEVVIYHFVQTRSGWRFNALDNLNE
ncbi:MAG TPA: hypothetical protein VF553_16395 [Pyrinomonadaceae bacterium]|jgi:hypothetical protein